MLGETAARLRSILPWLLLPALSACEPTAGAPTREGTLTEEVRVERVVDGDTILLTDGRRVRYIGIDTPETVHPSKPAEPFGKEASIANGRLVGGQRVRLEYDVERHDRYGRTLAYVWAGEVMVNRWLLEHGLARATPHPPNVRYRGEFAALEERARLLRCGMWSDMPDPGGSRRSGRSW